MEVFEYLSILVVLEVLKLVFYVIFLINKNVIIFVILVFCCFFYILDSINESECLKNVLVLYSIVYFLELDKILKIIF